MKAKTQLRIGLITATIFTVLGIVIISCSPAGRPDSGWAGVSFWEKLVIGVPTILTGAYALALARKKLKAAQLIYRVFWGGFVLLIVMVLIQVGLRETTVTSEGIARRWVLDSSRFLLTIKTLLPACVLFLLVALCLNAGVKGLKQLLDVDNEGLLRNN